MSKQNHFIKKQLSILMIGMMCITSIISGYAAEKLENDSIKARTVTSVSKMSKDADGMITSGKWKCSNGIIIELTNNVLTISSKGKINEEARKIISSTICASDKYKVNCIIENGITGIGDKVFDDCLGLNNIEIPNSVTSIGWNSFHGCNNLKNIEIPNSVISIGYGAFSESGLRSIKISNGVTSIGQAAFFNCKNLESIEIPDSVTNIKSSVLGGCSSLSSIKVGKGNKTYDCRNDCNAIIDTKTNQLIAGCVNTKIPNSVTSIGSGAFSGINLKSIDIPDSVTSIESSAFQGCENLESIKIPNSVTSIESGAFQGCENLKNIEISNSVTSIRCQVFSNCSSLESIKIPNSVTNIEPDAFWGCKNLKSIEISANVTNIGYEAFKGCSSLSSIKVAEGNAVYDSRDNCNAIINISTNELIVGCINTKIPNSVTSIGYEAFSADCPKNVEIPSSVTTIREGAFDCCSNLESIKIPSSVTVIGIRTVFRGCHNLKKITNYSSVELEPEQHNDNGQWYLENTNTIVTKIANGQTAVYKKIGEDGKPIDDVKYGDINSDGDINVQDGVLIKKYLAGIKGTNYNEEVLDVNADSVINSSDAVILLKYLAGMNVTIGK